MKHICAFWGLGENVRVYARYLLIAFLLGWFDFDDRLVKLPLCHDLGAVR